jgi:hypothetical protein
MSMANLQRMLDLADDHDRAEGRMAYVRYHQVMRLFAEEYGFDLDRTTAAFVALSPNNDYFGNLRSLASLLHGINQGWNLRDITISTYNHCRDRAFNYATGIEEFLTPGRGRKITAFYHNIVNPFGDEHVTVDGHMVCCYHGFDKPMKDAKVRGAKHYAEIQDAVKAVSQIAGMLPHEAQATMWFTRKRLAGIKYKAQLELFALADDKWNTLVHPKDAPPYKRKDQ